MANLVIDIHEQILVRSDVRNLIRFKSVCKSWQSLISSPHFIKAHLNHRINNDHEVGDRRITNIVLPNFNPPHQFLGIKRYSFVGSCNGLVCINSDDDTEILVANPSTRELKTLQMPPRQFFDDESLCCWGFGYDSSTDDYKVVVGFREEDRTSFQVFSLKSNAWKVVGDVKYISHHLMRKDGVFCNGALHWVMFNATQQSNKAVILSFDLSLEEFKEVPQPRDARCVSDNAHGLIMRLGIIDKSLCISLNNKIWKMSNYNLNQSWENMGHDCLTVYGSAYSLTEVEKDFPYKISTIHRVWFFGNRKFIGAHKIVETTIVQSLVSPNLREKVADMNGKSHKAEPALSDFLSVNDHGDSSNP